MERLRQTLKLIVAFLLTVTNLATLASSQNLYTFTTTINIDSTGSPDQQVDYSWLQPPNTTISISQETTTFLPASTTVRTQEILDSAETGFPGRYADEPPRRHEEEAEDDDEPERPADHVIPYSVHEEARDVPTQPKYVAPGVWAKPPPDVLDFVPTKLHAQVRGTHTVKRLPQQEAVESAETDEERQNAHRLKEVVTNTKVNTVYTEEGYEDSAYDHAGHIRDADFHEGFARKLHNKKKNKHGSQSGKRRKEKRKNLVPEEFKEYDEDYQDHLEESRKREKSSDDEYNLIGYGKNAWEGSEIDPKLVVANGIRELEEDVEENAEKAERSERIYQREQESRPLGEEVDNSESEETHDEGDLKDEENKPAISRKEKKVKLRNGKSDAPGKRTKTQQKKKPRKESYETTVLPNYGAGSEVDPEAPANPRGFVAGSLSSQMYSIDHTTLRYVAPTSPAAFQSLDEPTTSSYSQLFWDYFKTRQKPSIVESTALVPDSTTLEPRQEEHTPVAVATIDGRGPYLLVTKEETSTMPSTFFGTPSFHPQSLFSDRVEFDPSSVPEQTHSLPGQSGEAGYTDGVNNMIASPTVATFTSLQPFLLQPLQSTNIENTEFSSTTTLFEEAASTPAVMTLNFTQEAYSRIDDYQANPFLSPILDNSNIAVARNKFKYRVLVRPTPKKAAKLTVPPQSSSQKTPSSTSLQEEEKRIRDELSAKYTKMLDYLKSWHKVKPLASNKKIVLPGDLAPLKPSISRQRAVLPSRPTTDHPSVSVKSESPRKANDLRDASRDQHRSQPSNPSYRSNPFVFVNPVKLTYRKNMLPVTKLLPPPPLPLPPPLPVVGAHLTYHGGRQHDYLSHVPGKPQQQRDNVLRLFPLIPEASWRTRSRRKRSGEDTTNAAGVVVIENNENTEESVKKKRHVSQDIRRSRGSPRKSEANSRDHEKILNESPKISGDVIDKEIAVRFNEPEDANETSTENKGGGKVEIEVPNFDYVEELAEDSPVEVSTTTEAVIDAKKYPFYNNENVPVASALKYVVDPRTIPRKTSRGMEFYDSRNAYKQCDEVEPDLDEVLPEKEEPDPERGPPKNLPRLRGLGDKLDCFKAKYFDENPLDNPLFAEKLIQDPTPPTELDPIKFTSQVLLLPEENDDYVMHRVSKKPERNGRRPWRGRNPQYEMHDSIRVNYKHDPKTGRGRNAYLHSVRGSKPTVAVRRLKNRGPKLRNSNNTISTTPSPRPGYQTESYQNQVYEDVMGNIRNMANGYEVYEMTTLPPATQIQTAGSENAPQIADETPDLSIEKNTTDAVVTSSNVVSSEIIKGLVPPPKYLTPRRLANYRKYRPPGKRASLLRAPSLSHIIARHHAIKISKRSTKDVANSSGNAKDEDKMKTVGKPTEIEARNDTVTETTTTKTNSTPAAMDLEIEESRLVSARDPNPLPTTLKVDEKKRRKNSTSSGPKNEAPQKIVYTIRDRIRYSKPKWDNRGFGKFSESPKTADMDSRRKEPRYNHFVRKKLAADPRINSTSLNPINSTSTIESATSPTEGRESDVIETHRLEEPVAHQSVYGRRIEYPEAEEAESANNAKSEESSEEEEDEDDDEKKEKEEEDEGEEKEKEEETENTTHTYRVHEDVNENVSTTTTSKGLTSPLNSKEILSFQEYLEADPPGYAEAFSEELTTPSSKHRANMKHRPKDSDEKQDEGTDNSKNTATSWEDDDSSEKAEEQIETPKTKTDKEDDDSSEDSSSKEGSKEDQRYTTRPSWVEGEKDEKPAFYRSFPFKRYKSMLKKNHHEDEDEDEDSEEESEEASKDYVFPWHGDKKSEKNRRLKDFDRYEYPWERRARLAKERQKRRQREKRFKKLILGDDEDEDEEEEDESRRREELEYPWERYNVPSKGHVNTRRDVSPRNADDSEQESNSEEVTFAKYSSRYRAANAEPTNRPSSAREIGRSIKKLLEDDSDESKEETPTSWEESSKEIEDHSPSSSQISPSTSRGVSRGTLVPEDITEPPRRKSRRRKVSQYDKDISSKSRFDSKKLKSEEDDEMEKKEEEMKEKLAKDYLKLDKSDSEDSGSQASDYVSDVTKKESPLRKKRRRIIPKNNFTTSLDNAPAETSTVGLLYETSTEAVKKKRRKPQVSSTTTAATPSEIGDLKTSKSDFAHLRKRYSMGDIVKASEPNSTEKTPSSTSETAKGDSAEAETSTPKTRTIEHRSRVSKEKIVTKTTYPGETEVFDTARKNATFASQEPVKKLKIKVSRRKSNGKRKNNDDGGPSDNEKLIKRKDKGEYYDFRFKDDSSKKSVTSEKPEVKGKDNLLKSLGMRKEEVKRINNFSTFDGIVNDEDDDFGDAVPSETHVLSSLLQNIPPSRRNDRVKKKTKSDSSRINEKWKKQIGGKEDEGEQEGKDTAERPWSLLQTKFIKDPKRRLYYYVESK